MKNLAYCCIIIAYFLAVSGCESRISLEEASPTSTLAAFVNTRTPTSTRLPILPSTPIPSGPTATPFAHIVQQGETLLGIAIRYGVTLDDLLLVNPGVDPRILSVGQNIAIPGPGGEPIDLLLPTPTASPLEIGPVRCFPNTPNHLQCLVKVTNHLAAAVEGSAVSISLFDPSGTLIDQTIVNTLSRFLLPGQSTILNAGFTTQSMSPLSAKAILVSAVQVSNLEDRYIPTELRELEIDRSPDGDFITFRGMVDIDPAQTSGEITLTLQAFGFDSSSAPVGSNASEINVMITDSPVPFQLSLFSLSGEIKSFELLVEALVSGPAG